MASIYPDWFLRDHEPAISAYSIGGWRQGECIVLARSIRLAPLKAAKFYCSIPEVFTIHCRSCSALAMGAGRSATTFANLKRRSP